MSEAIVGRPRTTQPLAHDGQSRAQPRAQQPPQLKRRDWRPNAEALRFLPLALVLTIAGSAGALYLLSDVFQTETGRALNILSSGDGQAIGDYLLSYGAWAPVISVLLMLLQAAAAPIPAVLIVFANGLAFGVFWGGLLSLFGQTLAAAACFWFARVLGRKPVESLAGRLGLSWFDSWVNRWGASGILVSRLIPGISFDAVSYASGLTAVGFGRFLVATIAGIAPQSFLYAYLILHVPQYAWMMLVSTIAIAAGVTAVSVVRRRRDHGAVSSRPTQ